MAPSRSLRSRKQQTRLEFQPLSSSPTFAKEEYSQAVQNRLAKVRYDVSSRNKGHRIETRRDNRLLPTPQPTSPSEGHALVQRPSSPLSSLNTSPALPPRFRDIARKDFSDGGDDDEDIITPVSKRIKLSKAFENNVVGNTNSSIIPVRLDNVSSLRSTGSASSADNASFSTPARRSTRLAHQSSPPRYTSPTQNQHLGSVDNASPTRSISNIGSAETSELEDVVLATQPVNKRRKGRGRRTEEDDFVVYDDQVQYISSEGESNQKYTPRKRGKRNDFVAENDEIEYITSASEDTQEKRSFKPSKDTPKHVTPKKAKRKSRREREELDEDLRDLQDSGQEDSAKKSRTRGGPVTTQRDKEKEHFNLLKRRRAGKQARRIIDSDEDEDNEAEMDDGYDGVDIDDIEQGPSRIEVISDDQSSLEEGEYIEPQDLDDEDDFVVEDQATTGRLGRPNNDIPLQFTSFASAKPRELFPHIIEWMVKNKISPAFNRDDDVYNISFSRLDDQVKAQAGSRLISSAWGSTFKWAILARPSIRVEALPGLDEDLIRTCDACNKSNHPARYDFTFAGKAYFKETLEPVDEFDDEDDDVDNDGISRDEQGHTLASQNTHFYLGRFCAANAEMGHKLTHWKYRLNEQVLSYLEEQGVLAADAIVSRDKLNKKKREKEAEAIVDMMQDTGMIAELWQSFQDDLEDARVGMEGHERKGGRSKARIGSVRMRKGNGTMGEWMDGGKFRQTATGLQSDSEGE